MPGFTSSRAPRCRGAARAPSAIAVVAALGLAACTGRPPAEGPLAELLDTERRFASTSEAAGMKAAFLEFLDDESVLFRPHPVDGKTYTEAQPASAIRLTWKPIHARVAAAGDLGFTTGPYTIDLGDGEQASGYFVSLWRGGKDREWRVVMDLGTEDPDGERCPAAAEFVQPRAAAADADVEAEARALVDLERTLSSEAADSDAAGALDPWLADDARLYRDGRCPVRGKVAVRWALADQEGSMTWEPMRAHVSRSNDLAYSYGRYTVMPDFGEGPALDQGYYVRVWVRDAPEPWRMVADVTSPAPPVADPPDPDS